MDELQRLKNDNAIGTVQIHIDGEEFYHELDLVETKFTQRELNEIKHCLFYTDNCNHGADGHNRMNLLSKMAKAMGFGLWKGELHYTNLFGGKLSNES